MKTALRAAAPHAALPSEEAEAALSRALDGRRFDDPASEKDRVALLRVNVVDPSDNHEN